MWIKYWAEGNGGLSGEIYIAELPDGATAAAIREFVEMRTPHQTERGAQYKIIDVTEVPPKYFEEQIEKRDRDLVAAWSRFKEIPRLQKLKKESEAALKEKKKITLGKILKTKWSYSDEKYDFFRLFFDEPISVYKKNRRTYVKIGIGPQSKKKTFKQTDTIDDVIEWVENA